MNTKRQYEFVHALSKTSVADVYRCHEYHKGQVLRNVAIKIMRDNWKDNQDAVIWLRQELSLLQSLHHPTIPKIYEMTAIRGRVSIVMEWIEGVDIRSLVQGMRQQKQRIPLKVTLTLIANIAESLDVIYNQAPSAGKAPLRILHGNLKPSNIMVTPQGKIALLDFGMTPSDLGGRESSTREMQFDSAEYMAPERLFFEPQGPASDVYSLAVTLFEMLAGKSLGKAPASEEQHQARLDKYCQALLRPMPLGLEVKEELADLLLCGMSYDAEKRPMAYEFASRARRMAESISGVDVVQWSQKAIPYFQARLNRGGVDGTLQGSVLSEDTEIFERPIPIDDADVDTSIMRRGAVADFVEASLDLHPEAVVEMTEHQADLSFESTAVSEPELTKGASAIPLPPQVELPPTPPSPAPIVKDITQTPNHTIPQPHTVTIPKSSNSQKQSMEMVDMDGATQTVTSIEIRPQAMAPIHSAPDSKGGLSTKMMVGLFFGGAVVLLTGVLAVVYIFGEGSSEPTIPTQTAVESIEKPVANAVAEDWTGTRFQTSIESKRIKVKCDNQKKRGTEVVTFDDVVGQSCFVEVRTPDRQVYRTTVESTQKGLYVCFDNHTDTCALSGAE